MATKKTCDRCGKEIKYGEVSHFAGLSLFRYEGKLPHELCEECTSKLREWLHGKTDGERRGNDED